MYIKAMKILDDPDRKLIVSDALWLEVMPKPIFNKPPDEIKFYQMVFNNAEYIKWNIFSLNHATELAKKYGIAAMDAIHVAFALVSKANELVTAEKSNKPLFRVKEQDFNVISIC